MQYRVHDLSTWTEYTVQSSAQGRDSVDKIAIELCEEHGETVTMGKVIVEPITK
jgi:hypothetical protein